VNRLKQGNYLKSFWVPPHGGEGSRKNLKGGGKPTAKGLKGNVGQHQIREKVPQTRGEGKPRKGKSEKI